MTNGEKVKARIVNKGTVDAYFVNMTVDGLYLVDFKGELFLSDECKTIEKLKVPLEKNEIIDLALNGAWFLSKPCNIGDKIISIDFNSNKIFKIANNWYNYFEFISEFTKYRLPHNNWTPLEKELF